MFVCIYTETISSWLLGIHFCYFCVFIFTADYDYRSLNRTLTFEPSDMTRSEQCLEIEIIDDALAEDWEIFTVQLSTDSSAVNLTIQKFDVFILPNDGM